MSDVQGAVQVAKDAAGDVMEQARAAGAALQGEASSLGGTIRQGLEAHAEQQKNQIAERIGQLAKRVEKSADDLRGDEAWLANLMQRGARELGSMASEIEHNDVAGLLGSAEVFARRQPALVVGAAVALGFALTRIVRSGDGSADRYPGRDGLRDENRYQPSHLTTVGTRRPAPGAQPTAPAGTQDRSP